MNLNPMNQELINMFYFNAEFIDRIESRFKVNPFDFDHASNPVNVTVNAVHYGNPNPTKSYPPRPTPPLHLIPILLSPTLSPTSSHSNFNSSSNTAKSKTLSDSCVVGI